MSVASTDKTYRVQPTFLEILRTVGAKGEIFTLNQVFCFLKEYIRSRVLYDIKDPRKVHCENDALGKAFGVNMFTLDDVMKLVMSKMQLEGNVLPKVGEIATVHNACGSIDKSIEKRRLSDDLNSDSSAKRFRSSDVDYRCRSPMFLELGASPVYDSSTETVVSMQGYETSFAKDESDDLWYLDDDLDSDDFDSDDVSVEFEVMSVTSSHEDEISNSDDSFIAEFADGDALIGRNDSDVEFWADQSDSEEHSSDPDLCDADNWKCKNCGLLNRPPLSRYCQKCWQVRQGWLPGKRKRAPRSRRKRQRAVPTAMGPNSGSPFSSFQPFTSLEAMADGDVTSNSENVQDSNKGKELLTTAEQEPSLPSSSLPSGSSSENRIPLRRSVSDCSEQGSCMVCLTRPKNAILVHGRTGHQMCCYPCGKKLWETDKVCPICRRPINKVIRNFFVK